MPGASAFTVPPSLLVTSWAAGLSNLWDRGIPGLIGPDGTSATAPHGIADCNALEAMTPPTLRTAYSVYSLSIAYGATVAYDAAVTTILVELSLLINGEVKWAGTDSETAIPIRGNTLLITSGVINADLVNPVIINPRERLSLRVGTATSPSAVGAVTGNTVVGAQVASSGYVFTQSTISYQIIDLPGSRSL